MMGRGFKGDSSNRLFGVLLGVQTQNRINNYYLY